MPAVSKVELYAAIRRDARYRGGDTGTVRSGAVLLACGLNLDFPSLPRSGDHVDVLVRWRRVCQSDH